MKKMAKIMCLVLALLCVVAIFASCGNKPAETTAAKTAAGTTAQNRSDVNDEVPADLTYAGQKDSTITFFSRNNRDIWKYEMACENLANDVLLDAIHYRNIDMENRLGCKIQVIAEPGVEVGREYVTWNQKFVTAVQTLTGDFDGCTFFSYTGSTMATKGVFLDLMRVTTDRDGYLDLEKPWWNSNIVDSLSVYGSLFMIGGDILPSEICNTFCIFFNKDLFDEKFPEAKSQTLYNLVDSYQWTIDKLVYYVDQVWEDDNGNGTRDPGDTIGWCYSNTPAMAHWLSAFDVSSTSKNEFGEIQLDMIGNQKVTEAFEAIQSLFVNNGGVFGDADYDKTDMSLGNQMFCQTCVSAGETMRKTSIKYGVLTYPMLNAEQGKYQTGIQGSASLLALASNLDADRAKMISAVLEVMASNSYKTVTPSYYTKVLQGIYSNDEPDALMYDRLVEGTTFDFAAVFFPKIDNLKDYGGKLLQHFDGSFDIAQTMQQNKSKWETALGTLMDTLAEIADTQ